MAEAADPGTGTGAAPDRDGPPRDASRPVDRLLALYAVLAGAALAFPDRPASWPLVALLHLAAAALLLRVPPVRGLIHAARRRAPRPARFLAAWYPLLLMPLLYSELDLLNLAVWGGEFFDPVILHWEQDLFGGQPSITFAYAAPWLLLSELLHGSYISYYLIIYGPPIALYATGRLEPMARTVFALMLAFATHYLVFVYFPVQGPRYLFPAPDAGSIASGPLYKLAHLILEAGSSRGSAFPSSHVAVAVVQTIMVIRYLPRLAPVVALLTVGLAVGAVYGGFHYATDVVVGAITGAIVGLAAPRIYRALGGGA